MNKLTAPLAEVFSSFQGEGPLVGVRQVFIRFRGCPLTCLYCDTEAARITTGPGRVEQRPGSGEWVAVESPLTAAALAEIVAPLWAKAPHHSLSFTGGEPLLQAEFIREFLQGWGPSRPPTYLDTACLLPEEMRRVAPLLDWVAADLKLPSTLGQPVDLADFVECWRAITGRRFVKIVLTAACSEAEVTAACQLLAEVDPAAEVVLQPVSPVRPAMTPPAVRELFRLAGACAAIFPQVRVIPQCHRLLGVN